MATRTAKDGTVYRVKRYKTRKGITLEVPVGLLKYLDLPEDEDGFIEDFKDTEIDISTTATLPSRKKKKKMAKEDEDDE